ncbi:MAG TPA: RidA family protein [Gammaproteobacteria bacterium]|nr:RidA family protein [Gammaproteobacteria bacterium]
MNTTHSLTLAVATAVFIAFSAPTLSAEERQYIQVPGWEDPHFSRMVIVGDTIYLSGAVGMGANYEIVPGGIEAETKQAMENIRDALAEVDATMDDIVKCTVFLTDMSDWVSMNAVYKTFFRPDRRPARSALAARDLAMHAKVEIECIAVRGDRE